MDNYFRILNIIHLEERKLFECDIAFVDPLSGYGNEWKRWRQFKSASFNVLYHVLICENLYTHEDVKFAKKNIENLLGYGTKRRLHNIKRKL